MANTTLNDTKGNFSFEDKAIARYLLNKKPPEAKP
jgi:hypothetical protein